MSLGNQVIVVIHKTVSENRRVEARKSLRGYRQPYTPVGIIFEDWFVPITSSSKVIQRVLELESQRSGHETSLNLHAGKRQDLTPKLCDV